MLMNLSNLIQIEYPRNRKMRLRLLGQQLLKLSWLVGQLAILVLAVPMAVLATVLLWTLESLVSSSRRPKRSR